MTATTTPTSLGTHLEAARDLARRWDAQQAAYIRHRRERFATIARLVAAACPSDDAPRVLDLAGGTGSLAAAVLEQREDARVVVADKDPVLLAIAADVTRDDTRVEVAEVDLAEPDWHAHPAIAAAPFDAVVSSTALHWLRPAPLVEVYYRLAELVRPGGLVLNGDHLAFDAVTEPFLRGVAASDDETVQRETFAGDVDTWDQWWAAVDAVPGYAEAVRRRTEVWGPELRQAPPKVTLGFHVEALRSAGFTQTGTAWQYLDDYVIYAVR